MNISLETILAIEFIGEEINSLAGILEKIHTSSTDKDTSIGFKPNKKPAIEFTEEELALINALNTSLNPEQESPKETETNDISNGTNS